LTEPFSWNIFLKNVKEFSVEKRFNPDEMKRFSDAIVYFNKIESLTLNLDRERYIDSLKKFHYCGNLKELRLREWTKHEADYEQFFHGVEMMKSLRIFEFEISEIEEPKEALSLIAEVIKTNQNIKEYIINMDNLTQEKYSKLVLVGEALRENKHIEKLTLNCANILISKFYDELSLLEHLKDFTYKTQLRSNYIEGERTMLETCKCLNKVESMSLKSKAFDPNFRKLIDSIGKNKAIEELHLDAHIDSTDWECIPHILANKKLKKLAISGDKFLK
jgi:hypothetical protein